MKRPANIEKEVEQTLASIDSIQRAKSNPFLYTRVMASLNEEEDKSWLSIFNRPVIALATVLVVIIMNALVLFESSGNQTNSALQEDEQIFAKEYSYPQTTADRFYTENEEQP